MANDKLGTVLRHILKLASRQGVAQLPDGHLLQRFADDGEETAFEALMERHGPMVWNVCVRQQPDRHEAEDIFQATFLTLARKAGSIRKPDSLGSWLYGVAFRIAKKAKAEADKQHAVPFPDSRRAQADPLAEVTGRELCTALDEELTRLPEKYRAALVLCYLEGKTQDQAARQLGWSLATLKRRLEQGRERMRTRLERRGVTLAAALLAAGLSESGGAAPVSKLLMVATAKAAAAYAAGPAVATGVISANVAALTEGVLKTMFLQQLKVGLALVLTASVVATGAGVVAYRAQAQKPTAVASEEAPKLIAQNAAKPQAAANEKPEPPANLVLPKDLDLVPRDSALFLSFRVADYWKGDAGRAWQEQLAKQNPTFLQDVEKGTGVGPQEIERLTIVVPEIPSRYRNASYLVTTSIPIPRAKILQALVPEAEIKTYKDRYSYHLGKPHPPGSNRGATVHFVNDRFYLVCPDGIEDMKPILDQLDMRKAEGPLSPSLRVAAQKHDLVAGLNPATLVKFFESENIPDQAEPFLPLLKTQLATLVIDQGKETRLKMRLTYPKAEAAKDAEKSLQTALTLGRQFAAPFLKSLGNEVFFSDEKALLYLLKVAEPALQTVTIRQQSEGVQIAAQMRTDIEAMSTVLAKTMAGAKSSSKRIQSFNNLRYLVLAMHNYHDVHHHFPPAAVYSKDGKALYSWRVLLLPYLDQVKLYREFNLEEPWDSEHNKTLIAKMPSVFAPVGVETKEPFTTFYQVFHGKEAAFEGSEGKSISKFTDGTSNTVLIVEGGEAVPWTKPVDLPYAPDKPLPKLGGLLPDLPTFNVALADGSVRSVKRTVSEKTLRAVITPAGGEIIEDKDF